MIGDDDNDGCDCDDDYDYDDDSDDYEYDYDQLFTQKGMYCSSAPFRDVRG